MSDLKFYLKIIINYLLAVDSLDGYKNLLCLCNKFKK